MALKDSRGGREYDKFVADSGGDTALRTTSTSSVTVLTTSTGASSTEGHTADSGVETDKDTSTVILDTTDISGKERVGIQIFNNGSGGSSENAVYKVWGTLITTPTGAVGGSNWTQIGDDIAIDAASNAYKAISTTPIKNIGVTGISASSDTYTNVYIMAD